MMRHRGVIRSIGAIAAATVLGVLPGLRGVHAVHAQAPAARAGAAVSAAAVLTRARAEYATVRTARAEFTQEIRNPLIGRTLRSRGTLLQQKPGKLAVTFTDPAGDRIVSDGKWLWVYIPSTSPGQVLRLPAGDGGTGGVDLAATVLDAHSDDYTLKVAGARDIDGRASTGVSLTAKAGAAVPFPAATIWVDDRRCQRARSGHHRRAGRGTHHPDRAWEKNVPSRRATFTFTVPNGVKVVRERPEAAPTRRTRERARARSAADPRRARTVRAATSSPSSSRRARAIVASSWARRRNSASAPNATRASS